MRAGIQSHCRSNCEGGSPYLIEGFGSLTNHLPPPKTRCLSPVQLQGYRPNLHPSRRVHPKGLQDSIPGRSLPLTCIAPCTSKDMGYNVHRRSLSAGSSAIQTLQVVPVLECGVHHIVPLGLQAVVANRGLRNRSEAA